MQGVIYSTRGEGADREKMVLEIWLEKLKICINENNGAFVCDHPRQAMNHFGTFNIPDAFCEEIRDYVEKKAKFEQANSVLFKTFREKLVSRKDMHSKVNR